jgi:hypothetical protein
MKGSKVMGHWVVNEDSDDLPEIEVGDIVHFKLVDGYSYLVKSIVDSTEEYSVTTTVETVFDWESGGQMTSGSVKELEGEELELGYQFVHAVFSP